MSVSCKSIVWISRTLWKFYGKIDLQVDIYHIYTPFELIKKTTSSGGSQFTLENLVFIQIEHNIFCYFQEFTFKSLRDDNFETTKDIGFWEHTMWKMFVFAIFPIDTEYCQGPEFYKVSALT